jgi:hypothetical protein
LTAFTQRLDGKKAAAATVKRKHAVFPNALGFAVEARRLPHNPLPQVQWVIPPTGDEIDPIPGSRMTNGPPGSASTSKPMA